MSTYANITIEGKAFSVRSDGWDKKTIRNCVREYVAEIKSYVKPEYLLKAVLDAITADSARDYYAPFALKYCDSPSYDWIIRMGVRGGVKITGGRVKA